jgi:hypothetical protein
MYRFTYRLLFLLSASLATAILFWIAPARTAEPADRDSKKAELNLDALRARLLQCKPGEGEVLLRILLGKPKHVARQILYGRYLEQWTYDDPVPVRIEFDWRKGQEKQIQTVQPLSAPHR